jgi:hypothetical protein
MVRESGQGSEHDLALLTDAAIGVLADPANTDDPVLLNLKDVPSTVLEHEIITSAQAAGLSAEEARLLAANATAHGSASQLADIMLAQLKRSGELAAEIDDTYHTRSELMVVDPITISAAALLICILRIRRVRLSRKKGVDISFDPLKPDVVKAVLEWLRGQL